MAVEAERFWSKVDRRGPDECWPWTASRHRQGYGWIWDKSQRTMKTAHRVAWMLTVGPIPPGLVVRHTCDNPPCVNPAHLRLGTQADNMADMRARGRSPDNRGERNPRAVLSREQVEACRAAFTGAYGQIAALARQYGVSHGAMSWTLHGRSWRDE